MRVVIRIAVMSLTLSAFGANADEVIFKNGDKVTGKIEQLLDGKLTITSAAAGKITVDIATVQTLSTDEPVELHLSDGTIVRQRLLQTEQGLVAIEGGGVIQAQAFGAEDVIAINPPLKPPVKWTGNLTAGVTATRGNSDTTSANVTGNAVRRSEGDRTTLDASYMFGSQKDQVAGETTTTTDK